MAIFLYGCLTLLLAALALRKKSKLVLLTLSFLPFAFVLTFLWLTRSNYRILQVRKIGYQFEKVASDYRQPARSVLLGGDRQKDDVYLPELPPTAIKITPSLVDSSAELEMLSDGMLLTQNQEPVNAVPLRDGDRITVGGQELLFHSRGAFHRSFTANGKEWIWPRKEWKSKRIKEPLLGSGFDSHYFALSRIGEALGVKLQSGPAVTMKRFQFKAARRPVSINSVVLIGAAKAEINGIRQPWRFPLGDEDTLKIYSIRTAADPVALIAAGSYTIRNAEAFSILHSLPQTLGMKESLLQNETATNKPLLVTTTTLPYSIFPTAKYAEESKRFSGLLAFIQTQQSPDPEDPWEQMKLRILKMFSLDNGPLEVVTEEGVYRPAYGEIFALGKKDRLLLSVTRVQFPWELLRLMMLLFLLKILFQPPFFSAFENLAAQCIAVTVDFFLALRFLFSFRALSLYPFSTETMDLSFLAMLLVPYLLFSAGLCARKAWDRVCLLNFLSYSVFSLLISAFLIPASFWLLGLAVCGASAVAFLRFHPRSRLPLISSSLDSLRSVHSDLWVLIFLASALLLQYFGAGEALEIGGVRIPLSLAYHPVFLALSCLHLSRLYRALTGEKNPETFKQMFNELIRLGIVLACFLAVSFLTADAGFFLLYCVPVMFLLAGAAVLAFSEYELKWKAAGACIAAPLILLLLALFSFSTINRVLPESYYENHYVQRILLAVDPTVLEESGLLAAERQLGHQRMFVAYAHGGLLGAGYMNRPISSALAGTALNDNVPSVFLLNDFGMLGFAGVLAVLVCWALLWNKGLGNNTLTYSRMVSLASLGTILFVDLYMIFSNCGIFLFTGKNVFLWGLNSISDLVHFTILLCLTLVPLAGLGETQRTDFPVSFVTPYPAIPAGEQE